jgi:V/A-type H+-transporting ATPase subunit K
MIALRCGVIAGEITVTPIVGMAILAVGICMGIVQWRCAIYQGEASAAAINLISKRPEEVGRAIIMPALVETYAVVSLLASILLIFWFTKEGGLSYM